MFGYLCFTNDARMAFSMVHGSHIRSHNCSVFPKRFMIAYSFQFNFRIVLLTKCSFLYVPPFYGRRVVRHVYFGLGIFEEATPYTLFALFALFALLARPQPAKAAWIHRTHVFSSHVDCHIRHIFGVAPLTAGMNKSGNRQRNAVQYVIIGRCSPRLLRDTY